MHVPSDTQSNAPNFNCIIASHSIIKAHTEKSTGKKGLERFVFETFVNKQYENIVD